MSFRIGQCSSCGASYKLPASFEADQARCKKCGGVVQIGKAGDPAPSAVAPPVPAKKPAPAAAAQKPKRKGPSMKDRLIAERKAAEAAAAKPAASPAAKKAAPVAARKAAPAAAKPTAKRGAGTSRRSSGSRSTRADKDKVEEGSSSSSGSRRRRSAPEKKKSPMGAILGIVALLILGGGGFWYMNQDDAADTPEVNAAGEEGTEVAAAGEEGADAGTEGTDESSDDAADDTADNNTEAAPVELSEEEVAAAEEKAAAAAAAKAAKEAKASDPASVDLTAIEDFEPFAGTSPARVLELEEWTNTMMDPMAGAAGNRAKKKLVDAGREAMPIIINAFKRLDLTDDDGFRSADVTQKALQEICNGNNFGWKYPSQEPDRFELYDKKAIRSWSQAWAKASTDDAYWAKLAKLDSLPGTSKEEAPEEEVDDALDALDDF